MTEPSAPGSGARDSDPVRQRAIRYKVFEPVTLVCSGEEIRAHLLNISTSGALLNVPAPSMISRRFVLRSSAMEVAMYVVWKEGQRVGAVFTAPQKHADIVALFGAARKAPNR